VSGASGVPFGPSPVDPARERIAEAMVALVATYGYAETTVDQVCERARARRASFERSFAGKEDCFLCVHDELSEELCERVGSAHAAATTWHDSVWAAGWAAIRFMQEDPRRARFLVVETSGAGAGGQNRRDRFQQRLADILDGGRGELEKPGAVSRCTAEIVAGAIYGTVVSKVELGCLERGEDFLAELVYMAVLPYLGSRAAEDELLVQPLR